MREASQRACLAIRRLRVNARAHAHAYQGLWTEWRSPPERRVHRAAVCAVFFGRHSGIRPSNGHGRRAQGRRGHGQALLHRHRVPSLLKCPSEGDKQCSRARWPGSRSANSCATQLLGRREPPQWPHVCRREHGYTQCKTEDVRRNGGRFGRFGRGTGPLHAYGRGPTPSCAPRTGTHKQPEAGRKGPRSRGGALVQE
jgi:hypothetical protein